jgi:hypothetical protein
MDFKPVNGPGQIRASALLENQLILPEKPAGVIKCLALGIAGRSQ